MKLPERIGPYRIAGLIGSGGMGHVFRGVDETGGIELAVKLLHAHVATSPHALASFATEVDLGRRLRHPGLVAVHASGEHEGQPWAAMDLVAGESLEDRLRREPLPWADAVGLLGKLAATLAYLHAQGYIHRDLKPANVILSPDGSVRLLDLGIAAAVAVAGTAASGGQGAGTPRYMSPDQVLGRRLGPTSDVYSFGMCLFEAVAGRGPYDEAGETEAAVLAAHVHTQPRRLSQVVPVPEALDAVLVLCLAKDAANRYATTDDLVADLRLIERRFDVPAAETAAGRKLGLRVLRGELPGRAKQIEAIRRWLQRQARPGAVASPLLLRGGPGSGRTALAEWAAREARRLEAAAGGARSETALRIVDHPQGEPSLAPGESVIATVHADFKPAPELRAVVVDVAALGPGAVRRWARDEVGVARVDGADLRFLLDWSGGRPGVLEPLLFRWREKTRRGEAPAPGQLGTILQASGEEKLRTLKILEEMSGEARMLVELGAWVDPCAVPVEALLETAGLVVAALPALVGSTLKASLGVAIADGRLRFRDAVVSRTVREATDAEIKRDLVAAAIDLLAGREDGTGLGRGAELCAEIGRAEEAAGLGWRAVRAYRDEHRNLDYATSVETWLGRLGRPLGEADLDLARRAVRVFVELPDRARALRLLDAACKFVDEERAEALAFAKANILDTGGEQEAARAVWLGIAQRARRSAHHRHRFCALLSLAYLDLARGRFARAAKLLAALGALAQHGSPDEQRLWLETRANALSHSQRWDEAEKCLERASEIADAHDLVAGKVGVIMKLVAILMARNDVLRAQTLLKEGVTKARSLGSLRTVAEFQLQQAVAAFMSGEAAQGTAYCRSSLRSSFRCQYRLLVACNYELLYRVAAARGETEPARRLIRLSRRHAPAMPFIEVFLRLAEADVALIEGKLEDAKARFAAARELEGHLDREGLILRDAFAALIQAAEGEPEAARQRLDAAREAILSTSFSFRYKEFLRRAEAPWSRRHPRPARKRQ